ncbi:MAG: hypothetical protein CL510_00365 [Actinobacteria bacterium]|nr:hypothetical protein [Actinomycetota bacterium]|tara:strand:- start:689 stop:1108 length:420 start_codon:yes stop_codon:yes gene_type:complete
MRKILLPALLAALATPAMSEAAGPTNAPLAGLGEQMHDPERQRDMALMLRAMTEVLLDMPIAPLAEAAAEMAGEDARPIDPDMTLRQMTPEADRIGEEVARNVPRAMQAAGSMAEGLAAMTPLLREMAERFREAMPERD